MMRLYAWDCEWEEPEEPQDCYREITPDLAAAADELNKMLGFSRWATVTAFGIEAIFEAALPDTCDHEWVDARNEYVESGELCVKCNAIRAGNEL